MNKIKIKSLKIFAFHGLLEEEKIQGQFFKIDFEYCIKQDISKIKDNISNTYDYCEIIKNIKNLFKKKRYNTIETLGNEILEELFKIYVFTYAKISIKKSNSILDNLDVKNIQIDIEKYNE